MTIYRGITSVDGGISVASTADVAAAAAAAAASAAAALVSEGLADADATATAADLVATNQDTIDTAADLVATNQDTIDTAADLVLTNADVVLTNADAVLTAADVVAAEASKVAAELAYDSFDDRYLGAKATEPTLDNDGNALIVGALYFNSTTDALKVYSGTAWANTASLVSGLSQTFTYTATAAQTAFSGADNNTTVMVFDNDSSIQVFLNGVKLIDTTDYAAATNTITLTVGATAGDLLEVSAFSYFQLSDTYTQSQIDAKDTLKVNTTDIGVTVLSPTGDGSGLTGITGGGPSLGTNSIIRTNAQTISEDITIPVGTNGMSIGGITVANTFTVTVNGRWVVI